MKRRNKAGEATQGWKCGNCEAFHEDRADAQDCCAPDTTRAWACDECDSVYDDEQDAKECCLTECVECGDKFKPEADENVCSSCSPDPLNECDVRYEAVVGK